MRHSGTSRSLSLSLSLSLSSSPVSRVRMAIVHDLIPYGIIVFLVKFNLFVAFLILMSAIYLVNEDYYFWTSG